MVKDPVCGMEINKTDAVGKSEYKDETYFFCSLHCKESFEKAPERYIAKNDSSHQHHH